MLAVVVTGYVYTSLKERKYLRQEAGQSLELQQKVYQAQVLKEIGERIGYSLDTNKIVDIITSSLGNLLDYDTVAYMMIEKDDTIVYKCHVERTVNHEFIEQVKEALDLDLCVPCPNASCSRRATRVFDHFDEFYLKSGARHRFFPMYLNRNGILFTFSLG
jgi:hypothetical protein